MEMTKEEHLEVIYQAIEAAHNKMREVGYGNPEWEYKIGYVQGLIKAYENAGIINEIEATNLRCVLTGRVD